MPLFCPTDKAEFEKRCRVPLNVPPSGPGWQVWRIFRSVGKNETDADLLRYLRAALSRWLGAGNVDHVEISTVQRLETGDEQLPPPTWPTSAVLARKEQCAIEYAYLESDAEVVVIICRFVYRGQLRSIPWPTDSGFFHTGCPADVVWLLDAAWKPADWAAKIPEPPADTPLSEFLAPKLPSGGSVVKVALGLGVAFAGYKWLESKWTGNETTRDPDVD